jgi:hypothetical protein
VTLITFAKAGGNFRGIGSVDDGRREVDHAVEGTLTLYSSVERLPHHFALLARVTRVLVWGERGTDHADAALMRALDDLLVRCNQRVGRYRVAWPTGAEAAADVVDALKQDYGLDAGHAQHVSVKPCQCIRTGTIAEQTIASNS